MIEQTRIVIENVTPQVDGGRFAIKAVGGDPIEVGADIWKDGHELLKGAVLYRKLDPGELEPFVGPRRPDLRRATWHEVPLTTAFEANDRWSASFTPDSIGAWVYTVIAWTDCFGSWRDEVRKKVDAGQDVTSEILEGLTILERHHAYAMSPGDREALAAYMTAIRAAAGVRDRAEIALDPLLATLMAKTDPRIDAVLFPHELPLWVDRERARFGSWYEAFVRSMGRHADRPTTFRDAEARLPEIARQGFDVLYLPPIHPIGTVARKGKNNSPTAEPGDVGSPWAIGNAAGGHDAVDPALGTLADFDRFVAAAHEVGLEIALDFAVQCSPDHPWVQQHPEWFSRRPDGSIKYAENPPKKYQDIYPINFETSDRDGLYGALRDVVFHWIEHGVRIFRVDNPHTKPQSFWEWLITSVHRRHPEVLFLAEAFTRPKRMRRLAKVGFTQSYSYFTWRNSRDEIEDYATELFLTDVRNIMRPNFFANTPDILHAVLQRGGRPAFLMRLVLAGTLSPSYGIYSGFELCENVALHEGSEEYVDSEKYQLKVRDYAGPGNINAEIARLNAARKEHRALQLADNLQFLPSSDRNIVAFAKTTPDGSDTIVVAVNCDPFGIHESVIEVPAAVHRAGHGGTYQVTDLLSDESFTWQDGRNFVRLDPHRMPAHVLWVHKG